MLKDCTFKPQVSIDQVMDRSRLIQQTALLTVNGKSQVNDGDSGTSDVQSLDFLGTENQADITTADVLDASVQEGVKFANIY